MDTMGRIGPAIRPQANAPGTGLTKKSPRQAIEQTIHDLNGPDIHLQEQISPYITTPWWQGPKYYIEGSDDAAEMST
jgi:hypothetical protein